jgi:mycofactocin system glycosyltransferase
VKLALDPSTRVLAGGAIVLGGQPARMLRLTPAGARVVCAWRDGTPVAEAPAVLRLAARLIETGLAHPVPSLGGWTPADVAVVIPVRDRADLLAACLARVGPVAEVVVIDDSSADRAAIAAVAREGGADAVRLAEAVGPAQARNIGLAATTAPLVAFVDSDTQPQGDWLLPLLAHFSDETVGAVAPRIAVPRGRGALAAYEAVRSPLDLGTAPGVVGPRRRIGFVPAAALVVRRTALSGGFDATMRFGEDVDLVWRLAASGWTVRFEPAARVEHPHRAGARPWLAQRFAYGSSAGPLARRHPGQMRHIVIPAWGISPWLLALSGRPRAAAVTAGVASAALAARLPRVPGARRQMLGVAANAQLRLARQLLDSAWRAYPPLVVAAAVTVPRARRPLAAGLAVSVASDWVGRRPRLDPLRFAALRAADDLAYAAGVWVGCARARTLGPLIPSVTRGPGQPR